MTDVLIKRGHLNIETGTRGGKMPKCDDEDRDGGGRHVRAKKPSELPASHWKVEERSRKTLLQSLPQKESTPPT